MKNRTYIKGMVVGFLILLIGAGVIPNILTETAKADLTTDLVAWWSFNDGTADDNWGTYNGVIYGNPTYHSTGGPDGSGCFEFDGDGDFINTPLNQLGEQTISLWFKFDSDGFGTLISTHIKGDNNGNFVMWGPSDDCGLSVRAIDGWTNNLQAGSPAEYHDNNWHHVAFTHDGGGNYELFVGGESKDTYSGSALTDNRPYVMGRQEEPSSPWPHWLKGVLDDVRIYSRVLSSSEIQQLAGGGGNQLIADAGGPYSGTINNPIQLNGDASGGTLPYSWHWDFGDGSSSNEQNPTHTYISEEVFTVTLTITDNNGATDKDTTTATISGGCTIEITYPELGILYIIGKDYPIGNIPWTIIIDDNLECKATTTGCVDYVEFHVENYADDKSDTQIDSEPEDSEWSDIFDVNTALWYKITATAYCNGEVCATDSIGTFDISDPEGVAFIDIDDILE